MSGSEIIHTIEVIFMSIKFIRRSMKDRLKNPKIWKRRILCKLIKTFCISSGVNILQKKDKLFPNANLKNLKLFPEFHLEIRLPQK